MKPTKEQISEAKKRGIVPGAVIRCAFRPADGCVVNEASEWRVTRRGAIAVAGDCFAYSVARSRWAEVVTPAPSKPLPKRDANGRFARKKEQPKFEVGDWVVCDKAVRGDARVPWKEDKPVGIADKVLNVDSDGDILTEGIFWFRPEWLRPATPEEIAKAKGEAPKKELKEGDEAPIEEWLQMMPDGYREQSLENRRNKPLGATRSRSIPDALAYGFDWGATPQGYEYWQRINYHLINPTRPIQPLWNPEEKGDVKEGAIRHDDGKLQWHLLPMEALEGAVRVLEAGAKKYSDHNWRKGHKFSQITNSLQRHLNAFQAGEELDPESGLRHVDHLLANAIFLALITREHPEKDDRYKAPTK